MTPSTSPKCNRQRHSDPAPPPHIDCHLKAGSPPPPHLQEVCQACQAELSAGADGRVRRVAAVDADRPPLSMRPLARDGKLGSLGPERRYGAGQPRREAHRQRRPRPRAGGSILAGHVRRPGPLSDQLRRTHGHRRSEPGARLRRRRRCTPNIRAGRFRILFLTI